MFSSRFIWALMAISTLTACSNNPAEAVFVEVDQRHTGIDFRNLLNENENFNIFKYQYFNNGGGLAAGDFNNDGLEDLVFTGNMVKNRLYINEGNLRFTDVTQRAGIAEKEGWCTGVTTVDINQDGWLDLYICRTAYPFDTLRSNLLFINNGDLTFTEQAADYGLDDQAFSTHSAFFDYDLDGDLDLFLLNHSTVEYSKGSLEVMQLRNKHEPEFTNKLYRNDGGRFVNVTEEAGIYSNVLTFSLGISISDFNQDDLPDIFIGNDFNEPDYLFINRGNGTFTESFSDFFDHTSMFSMGSDAADCNNDGLVDLISLDMLPRTNYQQKMHAGVDNYDKLSMLAENGFYHQSSRNMLQLNNGDGSYSEVGQLAGVSNTNWSWAPLFFDFDNDGYRDLFIANGYPRDHTDMDFLNFTANEVVRINKGEDPIDFDGYMEQMPPIILPNFFYRQTAPLQFSDQAVAWGLDEPLVSQSAVYSDLDNDGDLDLVLNNTGDVASVYENRSEELFDHHYLKVKLIGGPGNAAGIGAKLSLYARDHVVFQEQQPVRGFQSTVGPILHFGLGDITQLDSVVVRLPEGRTIRLQNVAVDQVLEINLEQAQATSPPLAATSLYQETAWPEYQHRERSFNDFKLQSLLPWFMSRPGPALATADVNGDGREDAYCGQGAGSTGALWTQTTDGSFSPIDWAHNPECEDVAAVFFDADQDGDQDLVVCSGSYEFPTGAAALRDRLYLNDGQGQFSPSIQAAFDYLGNSSCVAAGDVDNDGDTDLFIGGGYQHGNYPLNDPSRLLLNDGNGQFTTQEIPADHVSAAHFTDLNNDGNVELVLVGEWTSLQVFSYRNQALTNVSTQFLPEAPTGLWQSLHITDLDQDGDMDIIAGNLGTNSQLSASVEAPVELYAGDFDDNGSIDPLLFYYLEGTSWPFPSRDDLINQLPELKRKFLYFREYAEAQLNDLLSADQIAAANHYSAQSLETSIFWNEDGQLRESPLPTAAQMTPIQAITTVDANQDGVLDIVLAGNILHAKVKLGRLEGTHGTLLLGQADGTYAVAPNSGINVRGRTNAIAAITVHGLPHLLFVRNADHPVFLSPSAHQEL